NKFATITEELKLKYDIQLKEVKFEELQKSNATKDELLKTLQGQLQEVNNQNKSIQEQLNQKIQRFEESQKALRELAVSLQTLQNGYKQLQQTGTSTVAKLQEQLKVYKQKKEKWKQQCANLNQLYTKAQQQIKKYKDTISIQEIKIDELNKLNDSFLSNQFQNLALTDKSQYPNNFINMLSTNNINNNNENNENQQIVTNTNINNNTSIPN